MPSEQENLSERPAIEPEIIPPPRPGAGHAGGSGFQGRMPGGVFFDLRTGEGATIRVKRVGGFKLALLVAVISAIVLALVLTFASLFVIAALVSACAVAVAAAVGWVKKALR